MTPEKVSRTPGCLAVSPLKGGERETVHPSQGATAETAAETVDWKALACAAQERETESRQGRDAPVDKLSRSHQECLAAYLALSQLLPMPSEVAVKALREVAAADPGRWSELSALDVALDDRGDSPKWRAAVLRLHGMLEEIVAFGDAPRLITLPDLPEDAIAAAHVSFADGSTGCEMVIR